VLTPALAELTPRQRQALELLRYGMSTAQIAACLFVSTGTVRTHIAAIVHKLRDPDREGALQLLDRQGRTPAAETTGELRRVDVAG